MGQEVTDLKQFRQVLEAGLACSAGFYPFRGPGPVGTATRSISKQSQKLFVVGVNDGLLPWEAQKAYCRWTKGDPAVPWRRGRGRNEPAAIGRIS